MWLERVVDGKWVRFGDPVNYESTPGKVVACKNVGSRSTRKKDNNDARTSVVSESRHRILLRR